MGMALLEGPGARGCPPGQASVLKGTWELVAHSGMVGPSGKPKCQKPYQYNDCNIKNQPTLSEDGVEAQERASVL